MATHQVSSVAQDYLKAIWSAQEWSDSPVTTKGLAERLSVSASTVSEAVGRLVKMGLVVHERYGAIELSEAGVEVALGMVRRHRLLETFLVNELGYGWDEVHDEAEVLEHAVSDLFVERIDAKLEHPRRDPHGDPIPTPEGTISLPQARALSELDPGQSARVVRVSDADPNMLRYCASVGLTIDAVVTAVERRDYTGVIRVRTSEGGDDVYLGRVAATSIWVSSR